MQFKLQSKLPPKQQRAIQCLLDDPGLAGAAKAAGVNPSTLWRWLQQPVFSACYRSARSRVYEQTLTCLQAASVQAVGILLAVMSDPETADNVKVSAARSILECGIRSREHLEFEERISALESYSDAELQRIASGRRP